MQSIGYSLIELLFALGVMVTVGAVALPQLEESLDAVRAAGAARYLSMKVQRARMEAITRSADVALRFVRSSDSYAFAAYVDGNDNGVRTVDIQNGVDRPITSWDRVPDHFAGVDFGVLSGVPPVEPGASPPGTDPIVLGSSDILTFTPLGTASPGSLYLLSRRQAQYVIRILGETGRTRVLKLDSRARQWRPA